MQQRYHMFQYYLMFDGDLQIDIADLWRQNISVGANIRQFKSRYYNTPQLQMPNRRTSLHSFFINDELSMFDGIFRITAGAKMERNSYTGWEYQPNIRAIVSNDEWALWASVSRAARTPNDIENGGTWNVKTTGALPFLIRVIGNGRVRSEHVTAYEAGARWRPSEQSLIELTAFKLFYKGVPDTHAAIASAFIDHGSVVIPVNLINMLNGKGNGIEANFLYQPFSWLSLKGSYTYLHQNYVDLPIKDAETRATVRSTIGQDPTNRFHIGISMDPVESVEFDANLYFSGPFRNGNIQGHHRLDMRLGWKPLKDLEISVAGQDMLRASHFENTNNSMAWASMIQQRYYGMVTYTYH